MPFYQGVCSECGHTEEFFLKISEKFPSVCPSCLKQSFSQDYSVLVSVSCYGPSNESLGRVAERNTRNESKELLAKKLPKKRKPINSDEVMRKINAEVRKNRRAGR